MVLSDKELIERLRKYARVGHPGQAGFECVVEKSFFDRGCRQIRAVVRIAYSCRRL